MKINLFTLLLCFAVQLNAQDFTQGSFQNLNMNSPVVADFDGDDFEDVVGRSNNSVVLVINDGTSPISFTQKNLNLQFAAKGTPAVGDVDEDDDIDIIFAKGDDFDLSILENDGDANFTEVPLNVGGTNILQLKDIDGDDDLDIIGINIDLNILDVYINDGSQNYSKINVLTSTDDLESFDSADFDDDGDIDIVLGFDDLFGDQIILYENDGSNNFSAAIIASGEFSALKKLLIEDLDGDNKMDIVAMKVFSCEAWINQGSLNFDRKDLNLDASGGLFRTIAIVTTTETVEWM